MEDHQGAIDHGIPLNTWVSWDTIFCVTVMESPKKHDCHGQSKFVEAIQSLLVGLADGTLIQLNGLV